VVPREDRALPEALAVATVRVVARVLPAPTARAEALTALVEVGALLAALLPVAFRPAGPRTDRVPRSCRAQPSERARPEKCCRSGVPVLECRPVPPLPRRERFFLLSDIHSEGLRQDARDIYRDRFVRKGTARFAQGDRLGTEDVWERLPRAT
jgi:hypothetical protein